MGVLQGALARSRSDQSDVFASTTPAVQIGGALLKREKREGQGRAGRAGPGPFSPSRLPRSVAPAQVINFDQWEWDSSPTSSRPRPYNLLIIMPLCKTF